MKRYILTSPKMKGQIEIVFKEDGWLGMFNLLETELNHEQLSRFIADRLPLHEQDLRGIMPAHITITEAQIEVTFETFWDRYKVKRNAVDAKELFKKLTQGEKIKAVQRIKVYDQYCQRNGQWYKKMYPDTWLRKKHFDDEWETL